MGFVLYKYMLATNLGLILILFLPHNSRPIRTISMKDANKTTAIIVIAMIIVLELEPNEKT